MAKEADPGTKAMLIGDVFLPSIIPIIKNFVDKNGGPSGFFRSNTYNSPGFLSAVAMLKAAEQILEPPDFIRGADPERPTSTAFRNGAKIMLAGAIAAGVRGQSFAAFAEAGERFTTRNPALPVEEQAARIEAVGGNGYDYVRDTYEPLVFEWEELASPSVTHRPYVRCGIGFVAKLFVEVREAHINAMDWDRVLPDGV